MNKKFRPHISKIKLNYEQAVLACSCYTDGAKYASAGFGHSWNTWVCFGPSGFKNVSWRNNWNLTNASS